MCEAVEKLLQKQRDKSKAEGIAEGIGIGRAEGRVEEREEIIRKMRSFGMSEEEINKIVSNNAA